MGPELLAILAVAAALGTSAFNVYSTNRTNQSNREIARENNTFNRQMWNLQTQYNTPANQMDRLKKAGLNTSLMYGSPQNLAGTPPTADETGKKVAPQVNMDSLLGTAMQQYNQKKLIDAQSKDLNASARQKEINNIQEEKKLKYSEQNALYEHQTKAQELEYLKQNIELAKEKVNYLKEDTEKLSRFNLMQRETEDELIKTVEEQYKLSKEQVNVQKAQAAILAKELLQMDERFDLYKGLTNEQINKAKLENKKLGIDVNPLDKLFGDDNPNTALIRALIKELIGAYASVK